MRLRPSTMRARTIYFIFLAVVWVAIGLAIGAAFSCGSTNGWSNNTCQAGHGWSRP